MKVIKRSLKLNQNDKLYSMTYRSESRSKTSCHCSCSK